MAVPTVTCPGFLKCYNPEINGNELIIPLGFVRDIKEAWPENVVLADRYGNSWQVKVEKVCNTWYFKDGWKKFVDENLMELGELMTFTYFGGGVFFVKMFGLDACEKKRPPNACEQREFPNVCDGDGDGDGGDGDIDGEAEQVMNAATTQTRRKRKRITDWFDAELFASGRAKKPENDFFVTRANQSRLDEFHIPRVVAQTYELALPEHIVLLDDKGNSYDTTRKVWKGGRTYYTGGWKKFCDDNFCQLHDKCICEFINGKDGVQYIKISIVRANEQ